MNITIILSLAMLQLFSQTSTFKWSDITCDYESKYDSNLFSEIQIKNCYLLTQDDVFRINKTPSVFRPMDIQRLNLDSLDQEFESKSSKLKALDLPKTKEWENIRTKKMNELDQLYNLSKIVYTAYINDDYNHLREFSHTDTCLEKHASSLIAGGDSLLNDWYFITTQQANRNGFPDNIWRQYYENYTSEDKILYAKVNITTFGWWNCAVGYIEFFNSYSALIEFKKLFKKTKIIHCYVP